MTFPNNMDLIMHRVRKVIPKTDLFDPTTGANTGMNLGRAIPTLAYYPPPEPLRDDVEEEL